MLFDLFFRRSEPTTKSSVDEVLVGARQVPLLMVRNPRARRYLLRLRADGTARVTVPRGGSLTAARQFVERNSPWLEQQFQRLQLQPSKPTTWKVGMEILFLGEAVRIEAAENGKISFGGETLEISGSTADLRPAIEHHLRKSATRELPPRLVQLAELHRLTVRRIMVRDQKSRWGSCSRRGTISLNWRLIQTPDFVRDYIFLHELMHLRQMNHSARFWRGVESVCPDYQTAERWLKEHSGLLRLGRARDADGVV
jgi:predicted metal-dependent hydrolase